MVSAKVSIADSKVRSSSITNPWGQKKLKKKSNYDRFKSKTKQNNNKTKATATTKPRMAMDFPGGFKNRTNPTFMLQNN